MPTLIQIKAQVGELFDIDNIDQIHIGMITGIFSKEKKWFGSIEYKLGEFKGEKKFNGPNHDDIVRQMKSFLENNNLSSTALDTI